MTALEEKKTAVSVNGLRVNNLRFADDIDLLETNRDTLQENLELLKGDAEKASLKINIGKTKTMVFGKESLANKVEIDGMQIDNVNEFVYLGSLLTWDNDCSKEIKRRLYKAMGAMAGFSTIWKSRHVSIQVKLKLLYGSNFTWLDSTRHVRLCRASRASRDERVERDEPCCSNMTDDEQACTSLVVFMLLHTQILFVSSNKIN